ncbi:hypothetical protein HMPREF1054_0890 [Haemophilus paraphrohaemolyticus HK411]|uniref:Uncharacterized protein n=1 Tax=Haemophilus paraphrohaemolyticus HK411 TaxID=1095743 RepID=I2NFP8_9PAST|nr:hypothetical protein HMPREF1054_0890 [Haemophilus paraphrohaemolyticus HK411]
MKNFAKQKGWLDFHLANLLENCLKIKIIFLMFQTILL